MRGWLEVILIAGLLACCVSLLQTVIDQQKLFKRLKVLASNLKEFPHDRLHAD